MDYKKRMEELAAGLLKQQYLYYVQARPEISDEEYDRMFDELLRLEKKFPQYVGVNSPSRRIGSDLDNTFTERQHTISVLSLDKVYQPETLRQWMLKTAAAFGDKVGFVVEEKIDGASIVLYYDRGELQYALTRGNGLLGNDVTNNVRTIKEVPMQIAATSPIAVRGEIFINRADFSSYNADFENKYANPRNLAAGSLRNLKSALAAKVPLKIFVYEGFFQDISSRDHMDILHRLQEMGFSINPHLGFFSDRESARSQVRQLFPQIKVAPVAAVGEYLHQQVRSRFDLPYDIDGLVVKVVEMDVRQELGSTAHHPRWAMAFKFDAPKGRTELLAVQVQVGRNGRVTPVAILKPVTFSGSLISRATLHNQDYIDMLELGIGDEVSISKRGDIIPAVEEVLEKNENHPSIYKLPDRCPFCSTSLVKEGAHHFCKNEACPERCRRSLIYFCAKEQMDIATLGESSITLMFARGWIKDISDIYVFNYDLLANEAGFKEKKISHIRESVEMSKSRPFARVLAALGFEGVASAVVAALIANGFDGVNKIIEVARKKDWETFAQIEGIGETTARLLVDHFSNNRNLELIDRLQKIGLQFQAASSGLVKIDDSFAGQVWVITGTFKHFNPRALAAAEIEKRGGRIAENVSSRTSHLLSGANPGSKFAKAEKLGICIIAETEFLKLISGK